MSERRRKRLPREKRGNVHGRSKSEQRAAYRLLHAKRSGHPFTYDPKVHPKAVVDYFQARLDEVRDAERVLTERGDVRYVTRPVRPPTWGGFAAHVGVSRECLRAWRDKHEEFGEACDRALAIQEQVIVELAMIGGVNPHFAVMMMKNVHGWRDRQEVDQRSKVTLKFDSQDEEA